MHSIGAVPHARAVSARFDDLVEGTAFELCDPVCVLQAMQSHEVVHVLRAAEAAAYASRHVAGFVTYEAAAGLDPDLPVASWPAGHPLRSLPLAWFGVFASRRSLTPGLAVTESDRSLPPGRWSLDRTRAWHAAAVADIRAGIARGDYYQVNLTARLTAAVADPFRMYERMASAQRGRYNALIRTGAVDVVSCSPELFFERDGLEIITRPMKGTARRGRWPAEDNARAVALRSSAKDRAENVMIVDLLRNDLSRIAKVGTVRVPHLFTAERFPTLWQLTSTVCATLGGDTDLAAVFRALFPCGSVTGAPKQAAMRAIAAHEGRARGVYCGAVGWLQPTSGEPPRARFSVAIRTMTCATGHAEYGTGGGITWSSQEDHEWAELLTKTDILEPPLTPAGLFETMRFTPGVGTVHLHRHLDRLEASARYFAIPFERNEATAALRRAERGRERDGRLRLQLDANGDVTVRIHDLDLGTEPVRLALSATAVRSDDRSLFHKQTDRRRYDAARAVCPDADDVVLHNERGEITETTTANLAISIDGRWWTPALDCGLLPGVERARLIEAGVLAERPIKLGELTDAAEIAVINSLRGWRAARIA